MSPPSTFGDKLGCVVREHSILQCYARQSLLHTVWQADSIIMPISTVQTKLQKSLSSSQRPFCFSQPPVLTNLTCAALPTIVTTGTSKVGSLEATGSAAKLCDLSDDAALGVRASEDVCHVTGHTPSTQRAAAPDQAHLAPSGRTLHGRTGPR